MARQETRTEERQDRSSQRQDRPQRSDSSGSQGSLARRTGTDLFPLGSTGMSPFSLMNPFSLMRRTLEMMSPEFGDMGFVPPVEISTAEGKYVIHADLPGMTPDDVKVEVTDSTLVLEGERRYESERNEGGMYRSERRYGQFCRSIPLPEGADVEHIQAHFNNGVLEVVVPVEGHQSRQIPIDTSSSESSGQSSGQSSSQASGQTSGQTSGQSSDQGAGQGSQQR
ncbi:MAG: heat shock protein Hsp20 [Bryobacterales bacterium]|nr:heat shock protein Hsp20 [Bryobacterales bacterium]